MSYTPDKLVSFATRFEQISEESLEKSAKKKEKVDPKAKVRNRGSVCVPAESAKDKKDHFPINDEAQARNALARVHQYSSTPEWYSGSLKGLQALVARKVKAKYPKIDVGGKDSKKKKSAYYETVLNKMGQKPTPLDAAYYDDPPKPPPGQLPFIDLSKKNRAPGSDPTLFDFLKQYQTPNAAPTTAPNEPAGMTPSGIQSRNPNIAPYGQPNQTVSPSEPKSTGTKGDGWTGLRINPVFQKMLNATPDTKLGPVTQESLNKYKASRGDPQMSNEDAFKMMRQEPEFKTQTPMEFDEATDRFKNKGGIVHQNPF